MSRLFTVFSKGAESLDVTYKKISNRKQLGNVSIAALAEIAYQHTVFHRQFSSYYDDLTLKDAEDHVAEVLDGEKEHIMIAMAGDALVGIALYFTYQRYKTKAVYITDLVVSPEFRSQSVGANLLKQIELAEKTKKRLVLELTAFTDNVEGLKFYRNQGMVSPLTHFEKEVL